MKTWKLIAGVLIIFVLGTLFGLLPSFYFSHRFPPLPSLPPQMGRGGEEFLVESLTRDLNLREDQKSRVRDIMMETKKKLDVQFRDMHPKIKSIMDENFAQIEKILDKDQLTKFREFHKKMDRNRPPMMPMPPPTGGRNPF